LFLVFLSAVSFNFSFVLLLIIVRLFNLLYHTLSCICAFWYFVNRRNWSLTCLTTIRNWPWLNSFWSKYLTCIIDGWRWRWFWIYSCFTSR
jgi:hypothetical protein